MTPREMLDRARGRYATHHALIGKFVFELVIIFVGVTAAFAVESMRQRSADADYRDQMIGALIPTLDNLLRHDALMRREINGKLRAFEAARARGERPPIPVYREHGSERPPTRAWDGIVANGAARSLDPALYFDLALLYSRQESFGERYLRYNDFTERRVFTLRPGQADAYDGDGGLKPEFAAHIDRMRDLLMAAEQFDDQAIDLRNRLQNLQ